MPEFDGGNDSIADAVEALTKISEAVSDIKTGQEKFNNSLTESTRNAGIGLGPGQRNNNTGPVAIPFSALKPNQDKEEKKDNWLSRAASIFGWDTDSVKKHKEKDKLEREKKNTTLFEEIRDAITEMLSKIGRGIGSGDGLGVDYYGRGKGAKGQMQGPQKPSAKPSKLPTKGMWKIGGVAALATAAVGIGSMVYNNHKINANSSLTDKEKSDAKTMNVATRTGTTTGIIAGGAAGMVVGAAIGTAIAGPLGTIIGGAIGGVLLSSGGAVVGHTAGEAVGYGIIGNNKPLLGMRPNTSAANAMPIVDTEIEKTLKELEKHEEELEDINNKLKKSNISESERLQLLAQKEKKQQEIDRTKKNYSMLLKQLDDLKNLENKEKEEQEEYDKLKEKLSVRQDKKKLISDDITSMMESGKSYQEIAAAGYSTFVAKYRADVGDSGDTHPTKPVDTSSKEFMQALNTELGMKKYDLGRTADISQDENRIKELEQKEHIKTYIEQGARPTFSQSSPGQYILGNDQTKVGEYHTTATATNTFVASDEEIANLRSRFASNIDKSTESTGSGMKIGKTIAALRGVDSRYDESNYSKDGNYLISKTEADNFDMNDALIASLNAWGNKVSTSPEPEPIINTSVQTIEPIDSEQELQQQIAMTLLDINKSINDLAFNIPPQYNIPFTAMAGGIA